MPRWLALLVSLMAATASRAEADLALGPLVSAPAAGLSEQGGRVLRAHVAGGFDAELRWPDFRELGPELQRFYADRGWGLAWFRDGRPTDAAWRVAGELAGARRKGLDPLDYGVEILEPRLALADRGAGSEPDRIRLDVALTVSSLRYAGDLALGRIRATPGTELLGRLRLARLAAPPPDLAAVVAELAEAIDPEAVLSRLEPDWPAYRRTLAAQEAWLARAARPPSAPLPAPAGGALAPELYAQPQRLAERLADYGLPVEAPTAVSRGDGDACGAPLAEAVARFQARNGLDATGLVDEPTLRELNAPPERRLAQLGLALERWRWFGRRPPAAWIVVNVPEFALHAGNGDRDLTMRVVVGEAYEWGTPLLASPLAQVVFRPTWGVPPRIQVEELLPRVAADQGFVAAGGFEVLDDADRPVAAAGGDLLEGLRTGALRLRQRPGGGNALGLVKLSLAASRWVYLHGTPAPELFARSRRDFSHGCIRVEDPATLAAWVLREEPGWTPEAIRAAMRGRRTREVTPSHPPTVLIAYFTAVAWEDGEASFFADVYGQDAALESALRLEAARRGGGG